MITHLRVQNFKSLKDVSIKLGRRNILIGPNMSGKSNFIEVFRFLSRMVHPGPNVYGLARAVADSGGLTETVWKGGDSALISILLEGDLPANLEAVERIDWKYEVSILGDSFGRVTVQQESLEISERDGVHKLIDRVNGDRVLKNHDGNVITRVQDNSRSALEFEIPDWQGRVIRNLIGNCRFYRLGPQFMKQANPTTATGFLTELGDNLSSWLMLLQTRYPDSFARIRAVCRDVFPEMEDLFTWPTQQATVFVASREKFLKTPVGIWQMSDGQLSFIALLSLVYSPPDLGAPIYCLEEPETHLHPKLLETWVRLLAQVQDELGPQRSSQIFVTTHSPHLVDKVNLEELIVVEKHRGETHCTRPADKRHLRELLTREEAGLGDLYYSGALSGG